MCGDSRNFDANNVTHAIVAGVLISSAMLSLKANEIAIDHNITGFKGSATWRKLFLRRHRLSMRSRTRTGQKSPEALTAIAQEFAAKVCARVNELQITRIVNADQTACFFEYLPKRTVAKKGSKTVWVRCGGKEKERATVMLMGDSTGKKYKPMIILKAPSSSKAETQESNIKDRQGFGIRVWKVVSELEKTKGVAIHGNAKGWFNSKLCVEFPSFISASERKRAKRSSCCSTTLVHTGLQK